MKYILYAKDRILLGKIYIVNADYMHLSHSVMSNSFATPWNGAAQLLYPWDYLGKNTRVDCDFLLEQVFLTQGLNPRLLHLLHWQVCSPSDSSIHGILQARILEWVAMPFSRKSSQPRD